MRRSGLGSQTVRSCIALAIALGSPLSHAATFAVNSTADALDANPGDGICETAAGNGTCTLRAALQEAKRSVAPRTINLPSGEYRLSIPPDATAAPGATGALDVGLVSLVGAGADTTIIDGGALDVVMRVVQWQTADTGATSISHVTIRNGRNPPPNVGGGIVNVADLTLDSVVVRDNFAAHGGGGIANTIFGNLTIRRSTISGNTSTVFSGAGISNRGKLKVSDSTISGNQVMEGSVNASGAGLDNNLGTVELTNVTLSGNRGGGSYSASTGNNYLANVTLFGNDASFQFGSGLSIARVLDLNGVDISGRHFIKNSIVAGNSAFNCVGALVSEGHNLDSDGSCGFVSDGTSRQRDASAAGLHPSVRDY